LFKIKPHIRDECQSGWPSCKTPNRSALLSVREWGKTRRFCVRREEGQTALDRENVNFVCAN